MRQGPFVPQETLRRFKVKEVHTEINCDVKWRFTGRKGEFTTPADGHYTVLARLIASEHPVITLRKAALVIKL